MRYLGAALVAATGIISYTYIVCTQEGSMLTCAVLPAFMALACVNQLYRKKGKADGET